MALEALNELVGKLSELRAEHERLGRLIEAIEVFAQNGGTPANSSAPRTKPGAKVVLRPDQFYGKTATEATLAYLPMVGQALGIKEITQALVEGGMSTDTKAVYSAVSSALKRLKKAGTVAQPRRNLWGLAIWYGGAKKKRDSGRANGGDAESENDDDDATDAASQQQQP